MYPRRRSHSVLLLLGLALGAGSLFAGKHSIEIAVNGTTAHDYRRVKLANGTYKPERYVISNGGKFPGTMRDTSMEKVGYPEVAGVVARHLAGKQYYLAQKAKDADLLIAIYWGTTLPFNDTNYDTAVQGLADALYNLEPKPTLAERMTNPPPEATYVEENNTMELDFALSRLGMENRQRDRLNRNNAQILGYAEAINDRGDMPPWADVGGLHRDLIADVEEQRYYIVLRAYDFKALQLNGKQVVRWTTRISIGTRGSGFDERMAQMVAAAADSFGQDQGLRRRFYGDPRVELGDVEYLGVASPAKPADATAKKASGKEN